MSYANKARQGPCRACPFCGRKPPYGRSFHKACAERNAERHLKVDKDIEDRRTANDDAWAMKLNAEVAEAREAKNNG